MDEIVSELNFDEGIAMPVANLENKQLEHEVSSTQKNITSHKEQLDEHSDRIYAMSEHLRNVQQELQHTQELLNARKREIETESHMKQIAQREEGRLNNEIKRINSEIKDLTEKRNILENNIFRNTQHLEDLKNQMNWDQKALEAWLEESARKDEDALTLQKYTRADEGKVKELTLRMEKMTDDASKKKRELEHELTLTMTAQIELDKTAEEFRKAHSERQELLRQWENTIEQMQKRDREMDQLAVKLAEVKLEVRDREEQTQEKQKFLESEVANNQEKEKKVGVAERQAAKLRLEYQDSEQIRIQFQDELDTLKYTVDRTAKDLDITRQKYTLLKKEVTNRIEKLERVQKERDHLRQQLKVVTDETLTAEEKAQRMDMLLKEEETRIYDVEKHLARLRETQFRKTEELHQSKVLEANTAAEIQGARAASRNLSSKLHKLDQESLKQQEIIYMQDFQLQQLERRISRMQGERSNEEKLQLEARIKELMSQMEEHNSTHTLLSAQMKNLNDDLRRANRDLGKGKEDMKNLTSKIEELNLHNDSSERERKKVVALKQNLMVDENILKLEIKRLRETLSSKADNVLNLEKRKLQLETAMHQRRHEIDTHKDMLKAQIKSAEEERQTVSSELHERISKIDKLRKRYEILMISMAPPEGEEERSQAYYVIKAAQEKEELQREGDELDAKIRKAEKEIRALENTLRLMNGRNETYRKSFNKVDEMSEEFDEKQRLEDQMRAVMDKYKYKRRQIRELQEDLGSMQNTLDNLSADEQALVEVITEKQAKTTNLQKELDDQKTKKDRAAREAAKIARAVRSAKKSSGELQEEKDMDLRELREFNTRTMKQMGEVLHNYPDLGPSVQLYFSQAGLPMPPSPGPGSSRPVSSRSSRSSGSLSSARSDISTSSRRGVGTVDIGALALTGSASPTGAGSPKQVVSSSSSARGKKQRSRPGSAAESRASSRTSSAVSRRSTEQR
ncbi:coiled-coil domain-containing protein 39-like [Montipora capricornis]|uniref:coiled-coil domain-containing protein 39-like n=1 Tax=Montipora foliosa TaxID=591990 RepID=UPI0035F195F1